MSNLLRTLTERRRFGGASKDRGLRRVGKCRNPNRVNVLLRKTPGDPPTYDGEAASWHFRSSRGRGTPHNLAGEYLGIDLLRGASEPCRHLAIRVPTIAPAVARARHLLQPVVKMDPAQVVEILPIERHGLAGDAVAERVCVAGLGKRLIEGLALHGTVEVGQP